MSDQFRTETYPRLLYADERINCETLRAEEDPEFIGFQFAAVDGVTAVSVNTFDWIPSRLCLLGLA